MRPRKSFGDKNRVGKRIVELRKGVMSQKELLARMQVYGIDIGQTSLSRLEGQERAVTDLELLALSEIFKVPMEALFNNEKKEE